MNEAIRLVLSMEWLTEQNIVRVVSYSFFFVTIAVFLWQLFRSIAAIKTARVQKKIGFRTIVQCLGAFYLLVVTLLAAGINGLSGIFWVHSFIGFSLTCIFFMDRASKKGVQPAKLKRRSMKKANSH
ncbi:hypothetical protein M3221_05355 [Domibacillus indicus]|jgi:hypothetical protein|uniref:hypothetical protein n=1 Tax=Domibacillus indicus TaxID=1437523 RepID=UPI00203AB98C|nr:hypothetical protein [Domibacillus indicus]MCM3787846.1 hypothetical protein [Domibacillus indicus]